MKHFLFFIFFLNSFLCSEEYYLSLGAFQNIYYAEKFKSQLKENNIETLLEDVIINNINFRRVLYKNKFFSSEDALNFKNSLNLFINGKKYNTSGLWIRKGPLKGNIIEDNENNVFSESKLNKNEESKEMLDFISKNEPIPLNEDLPYSVLVDSFDTRYEADSSNKRLNEMNIKSYIIKKYIDDKISLDVHAGSFLKEEDAIQLEYSLKSIGLKNCKTTDYNDFKYNIKDFDNISENLKKEFLLSEAEIPNLSTTVLNNLRNFPVDENLRIEYLSIADIKNINEGNIQNETINNFFKTEQIDLFNNLRKESILSSCEAFSYAIYKDILFDFKIGVAIISNKDIFTQYNKIISDLSKDYFYDGGDQNYITTNGMVSGKFYKYKENEIEKNFYIGYNEQSGNCIIMQSDVSDDIFKKFIEKDNKNVGILFFPEVRRNLYVIPKKDKEKDLTFLFFKFNKIDNSYAQEKNNALWAQKIVGNWQSSGNFLSENKLITISFFNLNYQSYADTVYSIFSDEKENNKKEYNLSDDIFKNINITENIYGWYLNNSDSIFYRSNELSFCYGSLIIAVNSYPDYGFLTLEELKKISLQMQIWEKD